MKPPFRIAIVGMGGFAGLHHSTLLRLEERGHARLVATCDPRAAAFAVEQETWRLATRGVRVFPTFGEMLAANRDSLDLVAIPTPIPLHAEMHAAVTALGLPCYLEKPPTLDHAELERMISADRAEVTVCEADGSWQMVRPSRFARRVTMNTPFAVGGPWSKRRSQGGPLSALSGWT